MRNFCYLALSSLFLFAGAPASAQIHLSMMGGANLASTELSSDEVAVPTSETVTRISVGVAATFPVAGHFGIQLGGGYSQRGSNSQFTDGDATGESLIEADYAELTALGRLAIPLYGDRIGIHLLAGPAFAYETSCDATLSTTVEDRAVSNSAACGDALDRPSFDFGLVGGGGLEIGLTRDLGLDFGALYNYGLTDLDNADTATVRHRVLTLRAGLSYSIR